MVLVQKPSQPLSHFRQEGWPGIQTTPFWNIPGQGSAFSNILSAQQHMASSGMQGSLFASTQGYAHASQGLFGSTPTQSQLGQGLFGAPPPPTQSQASLSTFVDASSTHLPSLNTSLPLFGGGATTASSHAVSSVQQPQTLTLTAQPLPHQNEKDVLLTEVRLDTTLLIPPTIFHSQFGRDVTHTATAHVFIPSRPEVHHVLIATIPLKASFMRVTVPAVDSRVFYVVGSVSSQSFPASQSRTLMLM